MTWVFVLDTSKRPLPPMHPANARRLIKDRKATIYRHSPFTIMLKHLCEPQTLVPVATLRPRKLRL